MRQIFYVNLDNDLIRIKNNPPTGRYARDYYFGENSYMRKRAKYMIEMAGHQGDDFASGAFKAKRIIEAAGWYEGDFFNSKVDIRYSGFSMHTEYNGPIFRDE